MSITITLVTLANNEYIISIIIITIIIFIINFSAWAGFTTRLSILLLLGAPR